MTCEILLSADGASPQEHTPQAAAEKEG